MSEVKTIGVLTSGGDAPGMNAFVRAVVRTGLNKGLRVIGIRRGYNGLIHGDMFEMDMRSVSDVIHRGGTLLYTARCPEFKYQEGIDAAKKMCEEAKIDGIIVGGGDGSFRGAGDLSAAGVPCIGVPCTIDNDIACTDYTIGYDTALNTAMEMIDKIRDTSQSHYRCSVVEVMGRHAGYIALNCGMACGATYIIVPEIEYQFEDIIHKMEQAQLTGKHHFIILVAEGVGNVTELAKRIQETTGIESRAAILGHVQRGGNPTVRDRVMASEMGHYAVTLLEKGIGNRVVAYKDNQIVDYSIQEALKMKKPFSYNEYQIADEISY
ncbi:MAG: 6-phosphofructokinase [Oscillospiraceae bacterium]|nr:6-phosphofructokinase [Oscillospiraceae bacterium]